MLRFLPAKFHNPQHSRCLVLLPGVIPSDEKYYARYKSLGGKSPRALLRHVQLAAAGGNADLEFWRATAQRLLKLLRQNSLIQSRAERGSKELVKADENPQKKTPLDSNQSYSLDKAWAFQVEEVVHGSRHKGIVPENFDHDLREHESNAKEVSIHSSVITSPRLPPRILCQILDILVNEGWCSTELLRAILEDSLEYADYYPPWGFSVIARGIASHGSRDVDPVLEQNLRGNPQSGGALGSATDSAFQKWFFEITSLLVREGLVSTLKPQEVLRLFQTAKFLNAPYVAFLREGVKILKLYVISSKHVDVTLLLDALLILKHFNLRHKSFLEAIDARGSSLAMDTVLAEVRQNSP